MSEGSRYSWGADEHLVVQIDEAMSLTANFRAMAMSSRLAERALPGVTDICPANASLLIRFDPDVLPPDRLQPVVEAIEEEVLAAPSLHLPTRIVEIPVWYNDAYTNQVGKKFRDRHQRPQGNDVDYAVEQTGAGSVEAFVKQHSESPWLVSMVGFVAGLPFMFQMVERSRQIELPKYLRPRTETPALTVGHGGCFACIYSVKGAGGYQMFGITPVPIYDPQQQHAIFASSMVLFRPGDIVKFRPIDEEEYTETRARVEDGSYTYRMADVDFVLDDFLAAPDAYNHTLLGALDAR
ncbi:5-oxoprolinase subunit B family protein [Trujillonella humicola]|uniref:5-oxoprolinase subunit B family protein n=1 Tax=Trujillonella humicola TaxID=3383699 RepID=UPI0039062969